MPVIKSCTAAPITTPDETTHLHRAGNEGRATGAGCYAWGRSAEATRSREVGGALAASLRDGSASGQRWLDLMHGNDILAAFKRCEGNAVTRDAAGRRACAVPLWIDAPSASAAPPVVAGGKS